MIKVLTFNKLSGKSEMLCIDSEAQDKYQIMDAIRRLVSDDSLECKMEKNVESHEMKYFESEYWIIVATK